MKAVILAGGEGTRLRPLTLRLPKPTAPIVDRPLLAHQLDLLDSIGVQEVVFSLAYEPERIQAVFGDGSAFGKKIHYAIEETPLGTGGAVKNAEGHLDATTVVFNGDVLTDVDLPAVVALHRQRGASATLVLTPVEDPSAYGLVETDASGRVLRFVEKPRLDQVLEPPLLGTRTKTRRHVDRVRTATINAGIYILETSTLGLMPGGVNASIERSFFPSLIARGDHVAAYVHRGYWIDIGTPEKYLQVHRDILDGTFAVALRGRPCSGGWLHPEARVAPEAVLVAPFYVGPGCAVHAGAMVGAGAVLVSGVVVSTHARVSDSVLWDGCVVEDGAQVEGALLARNVRVGANAVVGKGSVLGESSLITDYSRTS